ncbi:hypothetical protein B0H63DRAFT_12475 [Podospora didyma]|uniref:Uncharacterized protein n=1 Tax=Podospora didyma TaxID=330526 RepID=A0AAE0P4D0_9PEZI|nr:hypothetical protein B0H63DRAFT_12475 [Podospora didyma]
MALFCAKGETSVYTTVFFTVWLAFGGEHVGILKIHHHEMSMHRKDDGRDIGHGLIQQMAHALEVCMIHWLIGAHPRLHFSFFFLIPRISYAFFVLTIFTTQDTTSILMFNNPPLYMSIYLIPARPGTLVLVDSITTNYLPYISVTRVWCAMYRIAQATENCIFPFFFLHTRRVHKEKFRMGFPGKWAWYSSLLEVSGEAAYYSCRRLMGR